jgi:hypothetical protein
VSLAIVQDDAQNGHSRILEIWLSPADTDQGIFAIARVSAAVEARMNAQCFS